MIAQLDGIQDVQQLTEFGLLGTLLVISLGFVSLLLRDLFKQRDRLNRIIDENHEIVRELSSTVNDLISSEKAIQESLDLITELLRNIQHNTPPRTGS